uniref:Uncharacterized protein n=1 Tax=Anguilla anguilla TaxID=7936 RepID=A0A0E9RZ19_ANGAN
MAFSLVTPTRSPDSCPHRHIFTGLWEIFHPDLFAFCLNLLLKLDEHDVVGFGVLIVSVRLDAFLNPQALCVSVLLQGVRPQNSLH